MDANKQSAIIGISVSPGISPEDDSDENPLNALVRECLRECNQDYEKSIASIIERIQKSPVLIEMAILVAARYTARKQVRDFRDEVMQTKTEEIHLRPRHASSKSAPGAESRRIVNDRILSQADKWFDFPLPGNRGPIGDATREVIKSVVEFYGEQEAGMKRKRRVYENIGKKLIAGKRVRDTFSAAGLARVLRGLE